MTDSHFATHLRESLQMSFPSRATAFMAAYDKALDYLDRNVYPEIKAAEPNLTDHGPRHIDNIQDNILRLLGDSEEQRATLSGAEMYCLAMFTLFHDVGNVDQREDHHRNIGKVFDAARGTDPSVRREKTLVLRACAAHTGSASDGSPDTLKDLAEFEQFERTSIRFRELAAILRFADELAEGPQRTSEYRLQTGGYTDDSRVYQEYASVTDILIDRGNNRISLAYEIPVDPEPVAQQHPLTLKALFSRWVHAVRPTSRSAGRYPSLTLLLDHIFGRIAKLDDERRYAVHYSPILAPFKATVASFNFHCGERLLDYDFPQIRLDDLAVPGTARRSFRDENPDYAADALAEKLIDLCQKTNEKTQP